MNNLSSRRSFFDACASSVTLTSDVDIESRPDSEEGHRSRVPRDPEVVIAIDRDMATTSPLLSDREAQKLGSGIANTGVIKCMVSIEFSVRKAIECRGEDGDRDEDDLRVRELEVALGHGMSSERIPDR